MSYYTKILLSVHPDDAPIRITLEEQLGSFKVIQKDIDSLLFYRETKQGYLPDVLWKLKSYDWRVPESAQLFFRGEDDFKYRTIDFFPDIQKTFDLEESRSELSHPLHFNNIKECKPPNWDRPTTSCQIDSKYWIKCPGCNIKFKPTDKNLFINGRHRCGQAINYKK